MLAAVPFGLPAPRHHQAKTTGSPTGLRNRLDVVAPGREPRLVSCCRSGSIQDRHALGSMAGDALLQESRRRIRVVRRQMRDNIAPFAADEFLVILSGMTS